MIFKSKHLITSSLVKVTAGEFAGIMVNSGTPTIKVYDGVGNGTAASSTLTITGAITPGQHAFSVLTSDTTAPADGDVVVIGGITYRFKTAMTQAYDVQLEVLAADCLTNLLAAINGSGTAGVQYFSGTVAHPDVWAFNPSATTIDVIARTTGVAQNALATTTTSAHLSWEDTTLGGGTGASTPGVDAEWFKINGRKYSFVLELSETSGAPSVADEILWVTSDAVALDNMKLAINGAGLPGTDYSLATGVNHDVIATTNTNTTQVVQSILLGTGGNAITTTESMANGSWTGAALAGGTGQDGTIILNSFVTVAATSYRFPINAFTRGLYVDMSGAGDITVFYK